MLNAKNALEKARYFLGQAEALESDPSISGEGLPFAANLEAAIVYGRAALDHLRTELAPQFRTYRAWHDQKWKELNADPIFHCFIQRRNFLLHQEPVKTNATVSISTKVSVNIGVAFEVTVTHADGSRETRMSHPPLPEQQSQAERVHTTRKTTFYFDDPDWRKHSALAYICEFVEICAFFIRSAEEKFFPPASEV